MAHRSGLAMRCGSVGDPVYRQPCALSRYSPMSQLVVPRESLS